jgi:hypothetical protein
VQNAAVAGHIAAETSAPAPAHSKLQTNQHLQHMEHLQSSRSSGGKALGLLEVVCKYADWLFQ